MDGFGCTSETRGNAVYKAKTPNLDRYYEKFPHTLINASGMNVGLPNGQMGNSEVGHTNIGAGRVVYQDLTRITKSIEDGDFFTNKELVSAMENAKDKAVHFIGLLSDGGVHSHIDHLKALIEMSKKMEVENTFIHAITDGRDTDPNSGVGYMKEILDVIKKEDIGRIASISGRYYAMDRDNRWERVKEAYNAIVEGIGVNEKDPVEAIEKSYKNDLTDEFILPTVIVGDDSKPVGNIKEGDSVIFFNFRPDRAREITRAITEKDFDGFDREFKDTHYVCMTVYDATLTNVEVAYRPERLVNTMGEYLSSLGLKQLRAAETEKYAHVTFFFNGGKEKPYEGEDRILIPSPKVATYDLKPEMSAYELVGKLEDALKDNIYDVIIVNFANPDMVGHTGDMNATVKAIEAVDECVGRLFDRVLEIGGSGIITADHGNAELMLDVETGRVVTSHSTNLVPYIVLGEKYIGGHLIEGGQLSDIAPTMLDMLGLEQPKEMTGRSLIGK